MDWLNSREKKIFLTVLLILGIFVQWYGVNANSRIDLTKSIVEDRDFNINESYENTGDRSLHKKTYYSDKAPGLSFLATPIYAGWKIIYGLGGNTSINEHPRINLFEVNNVTISAPQNPGGFYLSSLIIVTLLTSTLSVAILSILIYRLSGQVLDDEKLRLTLTFGFAFGTLITHYGTMFLPNAAATLFSFSSFYLLYNWQDYPGPKKMVFAGFLGGFAVVINSLTGIVLFVNALFAFFKYRRLPIYFTIGGFVGGLPYMLYNTVNFGMPWNLPRNYLDPAIWRNLQNNMGLRFGLIHNFFVFIRVTFMPYRGIFFWFPMLFLSILGLRSFYKGNKIEFYTVLGTVVGGIFIVSSWWAWWHGGWFGARHLTFIMPFLMLPVFYTAKSLDRRLLYLLVGLSIIVNLSGFQGGYEDSLKDLSESSQMIEEAQNKMYSFETLANPVNEYYITGLIEDGVRSRAVDSIASGELPPDIRSYSQKPSAPSLLVFWIIITLIFLIWRNGIIGFAEKHRKKVLENQDEVIN